MNPLSSQLQSNEVTKEKIHEAIHPIVPGSAKFANVWLKRDKEKGIIEDVSVEEKSPPKGRKVFHIGEKQS